MTAAVKLVGLALVASLFCVWAAPDVPSDVDPPVRGNAHELGQIVLTLMPDPGQKEFGWDHRADSYVRWIDSGYVIRKTRVGEVAVRRGLVRANVMGAKATVLRKKREELWWTVTYWSKDAPKFGPQVIMLDPGGLADVCFGTLYEGCVFDPLPSLRASGVRVQQACQARVMGAELAGYTLSHPSRGDVQLQVMLNGGSGGQSTSVQLSFSDPQKLCSLRH